MKEVLCAYQSGYVIINKKINSELIRIKKIVILTVRILRLNNKKKRDKDYLNRWQLFKKIEEEEINNSFFDLLFKQTLYIWDIGNSLIYFHNTQSTDSTWADLQETWIKSNVGK